jgi:NAD(P)H-hydrate epimerase
VLLDDLGVVAPAQREFAPLMRRIDEAEIAAALPRRARESHKGSHGRVLVVGGGHGMPGALRLAGVAALRVGAGLVTVAGADENLAAVSGANPELIYLPVTSMTSLEEQMRAAGVLAIGPGLGTGDWAQRLWLQALRARPAAAVVDADALNLLAQSPAKLPPGWVITPHPGEAARLLGVDTAAVQADRLAAICDRGNPGMATAGMGDVLTGVIAGLRAQVASSEVAARVGVLVHALAGDSAATGGQRGLVASDVLAELRGWVNP